MARIDLNRKIAAELRRVGIGGFENAVRSTPRLPRDEIRFRISSDGNLVEFRRTGWPVLTLSARLTLPALKRLKKGARPERLWESLALACE